MYYLFLAIAIVSEAIATMALKSLQKAGPITLDLAAARTVALPAVICMVGYGLFLFFFGKALGSIQIGIAYSTLAGVGTVLVTILAVLVHDQKIDLAAVTGIVLIILGVLVIYLFSEIRVRD